MTAPRNVALNQPAPDDRAVMQAARAQGYSAQERAIAAIILADDAPGMEGKR